MIGRRISAHLLTKIITFLPTLLVLGGVTFLVYPNYFIFGTEANSGWLVFWLIKYMVLLPTVFLDLISRTSELLIILEIIVPTLLILIMIEVLSIIIMNGHIGMRIVGLKIVSVKNEPLHLLQIVVRTIIKYLSFAFFPVAFAYMFLSKEKKTLHDKVSCTKVVQNNSNR